VKFTARCLSRCDVAQVFPGSLESPLAQHFLFLVVYDAYVYVYVCISHCFALRRRTHSTVPSASAYHWPRRLKNDFKQLTVSVNVECSAVETYCGTTTVKRTSI
jgi:hypothetical protein